LLSVALALTAGTVLGGAAGYLGGWVDATITVIVESLMAFPGILLALALAAVLQGSVFGLVVALGVAQTPAAVRQLRAAILSVKEREFVEAARALGHSRLRIFIEQILPNSITPLIVLASTLVSGTLLAESALSFLGVGVAPPSPTWGNMLAEGRRQMQSAPLLVVFPGLAITLAVYGANLAGDILRDRLDPRMRRTAA
jgi:peptide/nickel transport system permease protein